MNFVHIEDAHLTISEVRENVQRNLAKLHAPLPENLALWVTENGIVVWLGNEQSVYSFFSIYLVS